MEMDILFPFQARIHLSRNCEEFWSVNEVVPMCSTQLGWVKLHAILFLRESADCSNGYK